MDLNKIVKLSNNKELKKIISFVKEESIFFDEDKRLLSRDEIINYKEQLYLNIDIIPLIDCCDNSFLVYNPNSETFEMCDVSSGTLYKDIKSIENYIKLLEKKADL